MAADVLTILDDLNLDAVSFVGHSTGGAIGQYLAARYPSRIVRLVLSATWTHCDPYFRRVFTLRQELLRAGCTPLYARLATLLLFPPHWISDHDEELIERELQELQALDPNIVNAKIQALLDFDGRQDLNAIACPTLVIAARDDVTIPSYFSVALSDTIREARLCLLDSGGHYCQLTRYSDYNEALRTFLVSPIDNRPVG
jgi:aminoacrylate hydrolase